MTRHIIVRNGVVENVILLDAGAQYEPPYGAALIAYDGPASPGDVFDGTSVVTPEPLPPPVIVPQSISRRQLILGLLSYGMITNEEAVAAAQTGAAPAAIAAMFEQLPEPDKTAAYVTWAAMSIAERNNPLVAALAQAHNMSEGDIDNFFIAAGAL